MSVRRAGGGWLVLPWVLSLGTLAGLGLNLPAELPTSQDVAAVLSGRGAPLPDATAPVEKSWVEERFPTATCYLPAPPGPFPCQYGVAGAERSHVSAVWAARSGSPATLARLEDVHRESGGWLTGLALGRLLVEEGRLSDAEALYRQLLRRNRGLRESAERAQSAVRAERIAEGPPTEELPVLIYLLQASGFVQIHANRTDDDFWWTLKSPIACGKLLLARQKGLLLDKVIEGFELAVPPPGCRQGTPGLTSYDLYNNLLVGYLRTQGFRGTPEGRAREFARDYLDTPAANPLQAVLRQEIAAIEKAPDREAWVWAVSNAERLLRDRLREGRGMPQNARLALTVAGLMESALERTPPAAKAALLAQQGELIELTRARRDEVSGRQQPEFHRGLARLLLMASSRSGTPPRLEPEIVASLNPDQRRQADLVRDALAARRSARDWAATALDGPREELAARLGSRITPWRQALRRDLAAAVARLAVERPAAERRRLARLGEAVLGEVEAPAELRTLRQEIGIGWRLLSLPRTPVGAWVLACGVAAGVWLIASWLAVQLRIRSELFASFYRREALERLRELE